MVLNMSTIHLNVTYMDKEIFNDPPQTSVPVFLVTAYFAFQVCCTCMLRIIAVDMIMKRTKNNEDCFQGIMVVKITQFQMDQNYSSELLSHVNEFLNVQNSTLMVCVVMLHLIGGEKLH